MHALGETRPMKTSIDHLPPRKQVELRRVVEVIRESFAEAVSTVGPSG